MAQLVILGLWALAMLVSSTVFGRGRIGSDLVGIIALLGITALCLWLLRRGSLNAAGYLMSLSWFLLVAVSAFLAPATLVLLSPVYFLPVLVSGAIVGGWAPFAFGIGAIAANTLAVLYANSLGVAAASEFWLLLYTAIFAVVILAVALISSSLSEQIQRSLTSLHSQADQMAKLAHTDPLTGLSNRRALFEQLESEFARAQRYRRPFCFFYKSLDCRLIFLFIFFNNSGMI